MANISQTSEWTVLVRLTVENLASHIRLVLTTINFCHNSKKSKLCTMETQTKNSTATCFFKTQMCHWVTHRYKHISSSMPPRLSTSWSPQTIPTHTAMKWHWGYKSLLMMVLMVMCATIHYTVKLRMVSRTCSTLIAIPIACTKTSSSSILKTAVTGIAIL